MEVTLLERPIQVLWVTNILLETMDTQFRTARRLYAVGDGVIEKTAQNELFETIADDTVLDFSVNRIHFGDAGRYLDNVRTTILP